MMFIFPIWLMRLLITLFVLWLVWALLIYPWWYSTESFLKAHYWWMLP